MQLVTRPWIAAGLALAGAGTIAGAPLAPSLPGGHLPAVQLAADFDLITPWVDALNTASGNATRLFDTFFEAPAAMLQQIIVNEYDSLDGLIQGTSTIGNVLTQIADNLQELGQTLVLAGAPADIVSATIPHTVESAHQEVYTLLPLVLKAFLGITDPTELNDIQAVVDFLASPLSGVLIGAVGPFVSPVVELINDVQDVDAALTGSTPDVTTALDDLIDIPANLTNAFLNGSTLDLTWLVPLLSQEGVLPAGIDITNLGVAFGGLLTAGATDGTYPDTLGIGGSIFNSIAFSLDQPLAVGLGGVPTGPIGALENLAQIFAETLGWDGTGNPLANLAFPTFDGSDTAAALSGSDLLGDLEQVPNMLLNLF